MHADPRRPKTLEEMQAELTARLDTKKTIAFLSDEGDALVEKITAAVVAKYATMHREALMEKEFDPTFHHLFSHMVRNLTPGHISSGISITTGPTPKIKVSLSIDSVHGNIFRQFDVVLLPDN